MSKYIIDTGDYLFTTDGVFVVGFDCDNKRATFYYSLDNLEELNSDYINEHYGSLQDEAYQKGLHDGESKCRYCNEYQRGLDDAWEAVVKLSDLPTTESCWIPVAERLPETEDKVMCCTITKKDTRNIVIGYYMQDSGLWACGMNSNVIAWMPLPDPYRKGAE